MVIATSMTGHQSSMGEVKWYASALVARFSELFPAHIDLVQYRGNLVIVRGRNVCAIPWTM